MHVCTHTLYAGTHILKCQDLFCGKWSVITGFIQHISYHIWFFLATTANWSINKSSLTKGCSGFNLWSTNMNVVAFCVLLWGWWCLHYLLYQALRAAACMCTYRNIKAWLKRLWLTWLFSQKWWLRKWQFSIFDSVPFVADMFQKLSAVEEQREWLVACDAHKVLCLFNFPILALSDLQWNPLLSDEIRSVTASYTFRCPQSVLF